MTYRIMSYFMHFKNRVATVAETRVHTLAKQRQIIWNNEVIQIGFHFIFYIL